MIEDYQKQILEKQKSMSDTNEKDERQAIEDAINAEKELADEQYEIQAKLLEDKLKLLDEELERQKQINDDKLSNDNLYKEARLFMIDGISEEEMQKLHDYEDEFGKGMGILGEYVHSELTSQIEVANEALNKLLENIALLTGNDVSLDFSSGGNSDIISQMKANSKAWSNTTDKDERARLEAENEELGYSIGLVKDNGAWYTDDTKTQLAYDTLEKLKEVQIANADEVIKKYAEDYSEFDKNETNKTERFNLFVSDTQTGSDILYKHLHKTLDTFKTDFSITAETISGYLDNLTTKIKEAIDYLNHLITTSDTLKKSEVKLTLSHSETSINDDGNEVTKHWSNIKKFHTGGVVGKIEQDKDEGLAVVRIGERVLTPVQTANYDKLVDVMANMNPNAMKTLELMGNSTVNNQYTPNISNITQKSGSIEADFNFYGSITQEALPQIKAMINSAMEETLKKTPAYVAKDRFEGASRRGMNFPR